MSTEVWRGLVSAVGERNERESSFRVRIFSLNFCPKYAVLNGFVRGLKRVEIVMFLSTIKARFFSSKWSTERSAEAGCRAILKVADAALFEAGTSEKLSLHGKGRESWPAMYQSGTFPWRRQQRRLALCLRHISPLARAAMCCFSGEYWNSNGNHLRSFWLKKLQRVIYVELKRNRY